MPNISLTQFMNFVFASPVDKPNKVREIRDREYDRATDLYAPLRDAIKAYDGSARRLRAIEESTQTMRSRGRRAVEAAAQAFIGWLGERDRRPFRGMIREISIGELTIRANPEIGMEWSGRRYLLKLFFPEPEPTPQLRQTITYLMSLAFDDEIQQGYFPRLLHIRSGAVYQPSRDPARFDRALQYEAEMLLRFWDEA